MYNTDEKTYCNKYYSERNDYYSKHVMGNIMNDTIVNIYYSPFYKKIREKLLIGNEVILPICKKCLGRE